MDFKDNDSGDIEVNEAVPKYDEDKRYTYADYAAWDDDNRYELIDGVAYMMSAPSIEHQGISMELSKQLAVFLTGKQCRVFAAPCDVCINGLGDEDDIVVQPDLLVVCDESKLDGKRCNGAPDMTIEILSPSTSKRDIVLKHDKYQSAGVREYWIVDPDKKVVYVHLLENGRYVARSYKNNVSAKSYHVST